VAKTLRYLKPQGREVLILYVSYHRISRLPRCVRFLLVAASFPRFGSEQIAIRTLLLSLGEMDSNETATLNLPVPIPPPTILTSLRTGKMKPLSTRNLDSPLGSLSISSAIDKVPRASGVYVSYFGLTDDEHDLTFHGGPDKAVHQYCSDHYILWQILYPDPEIAARFTPGGFGENLVASGMNETNICIGDKVRIGFGTASASNIRNESVLLEVCLPRQPCFKLNQRFGIKNFAPRTHELARTGWYYRVLKEGWIEQGMEISVVERPCPRWTIERLHFYTHKDKENWAVMEELVLVKELGLESRGAFEKRLRKRRDNPVSKKKKPEAWKDFRIVERRCETLRILAISLQAVSKPQDISDIKPGSHVRLKLPNGLIRAYSIVGGTTDHFELGIAREEESRGGSAYIHSTARVGDIWSVGSITESLSPADMASHHILIAGGIGITAFLAMTNVLDAINYAYELHYAVKATDDIPFSSHLEKLGQKLKVYDKSKGARMDIPSILADRKWNSHIFVCGPQRMMDEVIRSSKACGMSSDEVHFEAFQIATSGDPFTAEVVGPAGQAQSVQVGEEETLLEALRKVGMDVGSSCEVGNCGTCKVGVVSGRVDHRGGALSDAERKDYMLSCVSRGIGHIAVKLAED
jgi:MOSC domain-containing protein YiiM/ferredoxin-NADP reductase